MDCILTCGITPSPPHPKVLKTALSSCESVPCTHHESALPALERLRRLGYTIISLETTSRSVPYTDIDYCQFKPGAGAGVESRPAEGGIVQPGEGVAGISSRDTSSTLAVPADHASVPPRAGIVLVVGHEKTGVCDAIMQASHLIAEIPTYGMKNSLNVVTATSIMLFEILRQWKQHE